MLQINFIRNNKDLTIQGLEKKNFYNAKSAVEELLNLDEEKRRLKQDLDLFLTISNEKAKKIEVLLRRGSKSDEQHIFDTESALQLMEEVRNDKNLLKDKEKDLKSAEVSYGMKLLELPNLPHTSVPDGKNAEDNVIVTEQGIKPILPVGSLPHWDLIKKLGKKQAPIIDFELGNKITAAGFPIYKGKAARLQRGMIAFFLDEATDAGYLEVQPPILVNGSSCLATGQLPDKEGQMYFDDPYNHDDEERNEQNDYENDLKKLYLIPTAEVPVTNLYRNVIISESDLPVKNVAYTPCFRREAGSWGAHVRGLNRLHQFDKVEIVQINKPEESYNALEGMVNHVKGLLEKLELPYRILRLCGGDMGFTSALTYDFEVWSAGQERWLECSSVSNFETYQANRLKLRYKTADKKTQLLHTLNGSALALPRIVAALLENNQQADGTVKVPAILVPYCGFDTIE